jgi:hypothetical protein
VSAIEVVKVFRFDQFLVQVQIVGMGPLHNLSKNVTWSIGV